MTNRLLQLITIVSSSAAAVQASYVSFPVVHSQSGVAWKRGIENATLATSPGQYHAVLGLGNPPQKVKTILDTGSNTLWVNPMCTQQEMGVAFGPTTLSLCYDGQFDMSKSRSATMPAEQKQTILTYQVGNVTFETVNDDLWLSSTGPVLRNVSFGSAIGMHDLSLGIFGLGFDDNADAPYEGVVSLMARQNITEARAFGLALGKWKAFWRSSEGQITFGGVDTKKFYGELVGFPVQDTHDGITRYAIELSGISVSKAPGTTAPVADSSATVLIDSGSTFSFLPANVVDALVQTFAGSYDYSSGSYQVDCEFRASNATLDFDFKSASAIRTISIAASDLFMPTARKGICLLGVQEASNGRFAILGQGFLRGVYAVFDQDNKQVLLAPHRDCGSNIRAITTAGQLSDPGVFVGECSGLPINLAWGHPKSAAAAAAAAGMDPPVIRAAALILLASVMAAVL